MSIAFHSHITRSSWPKNDQAKLKRREPTKKLCSMAP